MLIVRLSRLRLLLLRELCVKRSRKGGVEPLSRPWSFEDAEAAPEGLMAEAAIVRPWQTNVANEGVNDA